MRILVVEDDKDRLLAVKGLKQAGFVVDQADDGQSGLDLALGAPMMSPLSMSCCLGWTA